MCLSITLTDQYIDSEKDYSGCIYYEQSLNEVTHHCCKFLELAAEDGYSEELFKFTEATDQASIKSLGSCE